MSFVSIIVTYGNVDRYEGVVNTIESVVDAGTKKVFLVDNGCHYSISSKIKNQFSGFNIRVRRFEENKGSAEGFSTGIKMVMEDAQVSGQTYILILDDDVLLDRNFADRFLSINQTLVESNKHVWSLFRKDRDETFANGYDRNINYYYNSVAGFSLLRKSRKNFNSILNNISCPIFVPWAGLFIKKKDLVSIELPDPKFFVYEDDADFSLNIRKQEYKILRSPELVLRENSKSWFESDSKKSGYKIYYGGFANSGRFLYKVRNNIYLIRRNLVTNVFAFYTNVFIFIIAGFIKYGKFNKDGFTRLKLLCQAVTDGLRKNLGENKNWKL
ncbi:glycosyltransferase family 2 protein [Secundilactobacillus collinoides]|nr:glycosyltransferase [Secundilactobacillus collinoides]